MDDQAQRKRRTQLITLAVFGAVILIAVLIAVSQSGGGSDTETEGTSSVLSEIDGIPQDNTVLGEKDATVTLTEFGDLQCPICRAFTKQEAPELIDKYVRPGEVKYDFKQWLIIGPQSKDAGAGAYAAGEQDHYWDFLLVFYDQQQAENSGYVTPAFLEGIAKDAGVPDLDKWKTDSAVSKWLPTFDATDKEANSLKFTGTPSFTVDGPNGRKVLGGGSVPSVAQVEAAIEAVK